EGRLARLEVEPPRAHLLGGLAVGLGERAQLALARLEALRRRRALLGEPALAVLRPLHARLGLRLLHLPHRALLARGLERVVTLGELRARLGGLLLARV